MNRLASEGIRFNAFTTAPQCSPSRASLTTGRYPHCNGVLGLTHAHFGWDLNAGERTLPQLVRSAGYRSAHFGVEHATRSGDRIGADLFDPGRDPTTILPAAASFMASSNAAPFLLQIGLGETHRVEGSHFGNQPYDAHGVTVPPYLPNTPDTRADLADFQGCVNRADAIIGRVLEVIDRQGLADRTLVIYVSDHGVAFPRAKCTLYDPGIALSLIARLPGSVFSGGRQPIGMVSILDVAPTVIELAGLERPSNLHGRSLVPVASGFDPGWHAVFAEKTFHTYYDPMRSIRTDRWKYIRNFEAAAGIEIPMDIAGSRSYKACAGALVPKHHPPAELYDLEADPIEQANIAGQPFIAETEADLHGRLVTWMHATADPLLDGPVPSPFYRDAQISMRAAP